MQLVNQQEENVELSYGAKTRRHAAQPPRQFARGVAIELQDGDDLANPARRHPRAMERLDVAFVDALERPKERIYTGFEERRARYLHVTEARVGFII